MPSVLFCWHLKDIQWYKNGQTLLKPFSSSKLFALPLLQNKKQQADMSKLSAPSDPVNEWQLPIAERCFASKKKYRRRTEGKRQNLLSSQQKCASFRKDSSLTILQKRVHVRARVWIAGSPSCSTTRMTILCKIYSGSCKHKTWVTAKSIGSILSHHHLGPIKRTTLNLHVLYPSHLCPANSICSYCCILD